MPLKPIKDRIPPWLQEEQQGVVLRVYITSRASRNRIVGVYDERLKLQISAVPVDGEANETLRRFLAEKLQISKVQIEISTGMSNRRKTLRIQGLPIMKVLWLLSPQLHS